MKITVHEKRQKVKKESYPRLMISTTGTIVLFYAPWSGTCLRAGEPIESVGAYSTNWDMERFSDFEGTVELKND